MGGGKQGVDASLAFRRIFAAAANGEPFDGVARVGRDGREQPIAVTGHHGARHAADGQERRPRLGATAHDLEEGSVGDRRPVREILHLGDPIPLDAQRREERFLPGIEFVAAPCPPHLGDRIEDVGVIEPGQALPAGPVQATRGLESRPEFRPEQRQVPHVVRGIAKLRGTQGPSIPVGEGVALGERVAEEALDQFSQGRGIVRSGEGRRDLHVDDVLRRRSAVAAHGGEVRGAGMHEGGVLRRADDLPDRRKFADRERIDEVDPLAGRQLDQAGLGEVGDLADELGIEGERLLSRDMLQGLGEPGRIGDQRRFALRDQRVVQRRLGRLGARVRFAVLFRALSPPIRHAMLESISGGLPSWGPSLKMTSVRLVCRVILLGVAAMLPAACRRPAPVYDRIPDPISMRDVVRAESVVAAASGPEVDPLLGEFELIAVETVLDRHQAAYEEVRLRDVQPLLDDLPLEAGDGDDLDPHAHRLLRQRIARHRAVLSRVAALDEEALEELATILGPARGPLIERLRFARALARANAVVVADGGGHLFDLRAELLRLAPNRSSYAAAEPALVRHESAALPLVERIVEAQVRLPLEYREIIRRRGPPEADVPEALDGREREQAVNRASIDRIHAARRELELALTEYQELIDRALVDVTAALEPDEAARLALTVQRIRIPDDASRGGRDTAFEMLIASRALDLPFEARRRLAVLRERFLEEELERLPAIASLRALRRVDPDPGREAARQIQSATLQRARNQSYAQLRQAYEREVDPAIRDRIVALRFSLRSEMPGLLAELVGPAAAREVLRERPDGFGDGVPNEIISPRASGKGDLQFMLPSAPNSEDVERLCDRARLGENDRLVVRAVVDAWLDDWDAEVERSQAAIQSAVGSLMALNDESSTEDFDRGIARILAVVDTTRRARGALDRTLAEDLVAAVAGLAGAPMALWEAERGEDGFRCDWDDLPLAEQLRVPPMAALRLFDAIGRSGVSRNGPAAIVGALEGRERSITEAGERLRSLALSTIHRLLVESIEARRGGGDDEDAIDEDRPEVRRALAPVRDAGARLAEEQAEALRVCVAALSPHEGRRLRETVAVLALPALASGGEAPTRLLGELAASRALDDSRRRRLEEIIERRAAARDAALEPILAKANLPETSEAARRPDSAIAAAVFARMDADARALRMAYAILSPEERERYGPILAQLLGWFDEPGRAYRMYE